MFLLAALRARFLIECLADLKKKLMKMGLNLLIQHGKPEEIIPTLVKAFGAHTVMIFAPTWKYFVVIFDFLPSVPNKMENAYIL